MSSDDDRVIAQLGAITAALNSLVRYHANLNPAAGPDLFDAAMKEVMQLIGEPYLSPARQILQKSIFSGVQHQRTPSS